MNFNPFDGVQPGFGPFANIFDSWVNVLIGLVWAGGFIFCAVNLVIAIAKTAQGRKRHQVDAEGNAWAIVWPIAGIVGLVLVPVIWASLVN